MPRKRLDSARGQVGRIKVMSHYRKQLTPLVADVEATQGRCPEGHLLPHRTENGSCTPLYCAGGKPLGPQPTRTQQEKATAFKTASAKKIKGEKEKVMKLLSEEADRTIDALIPADTPGYEEARRAAKHQKAEELIRLAQGIGRYAAMKAYFKVPDNLAGAEAEAWVSKRALELSVDALTELERQLKLGDDFQRREAARDILKMNGLDKKEAPPQANAVIVLNNPAGIAGIPWLRPVEQPKPLEQPVTVDALPVRVVAAGVPAGAPAAGVPANTAPANTAPASTTTVAANTTNMTAEVTNAEEPAREARGLEAGQDAAAADVAGGAAASHAGPPPGGAAADEPNAAGVHL